MNEQLKFSWGHIIAFLAIIFISYVTFVGVTYMTNGNFNTASLAMIVIALVLTFLFIGAQGAKAAESKFSRKIKLERALVFSSPVIFSVCMFPLFHFWSVQENEEKIVKEFTEAIEASKHMFADYEEYSNARIATYQNTLTKVLSTTKRGKTELAEKAGFETGKESIQKANMEQTLKLQLLSENYTNLKNEAIEWIENSSKGASTWNVFIIGNTKHIREAIHSWNEELHKNTTYIMSNEAVLGDTIALFGANNASLLAVDRGFDNMEEMYTTFGHRNTTGFIFAIVLYLALLFPYILQRRHSKNVYKLVGTSRPVSKGDSSDYEIGNIYGDEESTDANNQDEDKESDRPNKKIDDSDFSSFTM